MDEGDDIKDPETWIKANPALGVSVFYDFIEKRVNEALTTPSKMNDVLTKNFNVWTSSKSRWLNYETWKKNAVAFDLDELEGRPCYAGLDLSTSIDLTALALNFPPHISGREAQETIPLFFCRKRG